MPDHISAEAKDLLFRLLQKNPKDRIGIEEVLKHPFMVKYCGPPNVGNATNKSPISYHTTDSGILTMSSGAHESSSAPRPPLQMLKRSRSEERFNPMPVLKPIYKNQLLNTNNNAAGVGMPTNGTDTLFHGVMQQLDQFQIHNPPTNYSSDHNVLSGIASPKTSLHMGHQKQNPHFQQILPQPKMDVPPFTTERLQPTRHRTKNAVLTLCKSGEVVLEFIKYKPRFREERIVDVCRISSDGHRVLMFQPTVHGGAKVDDEGPIEIPPMATQEHFTYDTLPQKHWKKYVYAARFVSLVKAKTPKVTYYSARAKCVLMESGTDFEMHFYENEERITASELVIGDREEVSSGNVKVSDRLGGQETVELNVGDPYMKLSNHSRLLFSHFVECLRHCQMIARTLMELQGSSGGKALFPVIIGRRPAAAVASSKINNTNTEGTPRTPQTMQMPSFAMSTASAPNLMTTNRGPDHDLENQLGRVVVPGIGIATRYSNGNVTVEYHDGSRMCVLAQAEGGGIRVTHSNGMTMYYTPADELPQLVRQRLAEVPKILKQLCGQGDGVDSGYGMMTPQAPMRYASTGLLTGQGATNGKVQSSVQNGYGSARLHHMR